LSQRILGSIAGARLVVRLNDEIVMLRGRVSMEFRFCSARLHMAIAYVMACTAFASGARTASAQDVTTAVEAPNVAVLGTYVNADDVRGVDHGQGIQFSMAWALSDVTQLQIATSYINFDTGVPATDFYRSSAGVELVRYFNPRGFAPFFVVGAGVAYNDVAMAALDRAVVTTTTGLGLLSPPLTDYGIRLRGEARYVHDRFVGKPEDVHFSLGWFFPLRRPRTVEVVRTEYREVVKEVIREVPVRDTDRDGVPDDVDECADTLSAAKVDARGCVPVRAVIQLAGVHFEYNSARLTENSKSILSMAAASLRGQSGMRVEVAGHTDDRGGDSYNLELSRRRAQSVAEYLKGVGIDLSRMEARGYGESQPMDSNSTDTGRERNRRVEFRVLSN
jgi:OOP family OmpA-OmpF porin